jgi:hypothetical protein
MANAHGTDPAGWCAAGDRRLRRAGVVYVDAALPGRGHSATPEFLNRLATPDGLLPPWTTWWDYASD